MPTPEAVEAKRCSFSRLLALHLETLRVKRHSVATQQQSREVLPRLFEYLHQRAVLHPRQVSESHLTGFLRHLQKRKTYRGTPLSLWTQSTYLVAIRRFFAFLKTRGIILRNPARELALPKAIRLPRAVPTPAQARRLMNAPASSSPLGLRDRALLELLYGTGMRVGECTRLELTDVRLSEETILIRNGKGKKDRVVPLTGRATAALDTYLRQARPALLADPPPMALFLNRWGTKALGIQGVQIQVREYARAIGLNIAVTPHSLRHACATHLLKGGADVRHVQQLLGHRHISTTALYTRVDIKDLRAMVERSHPRERGRRQPR